MLLCSNYKLLTGDSDFLEPALQNRFAVLPFPYIMENVDERVKSFEKKYLPRERQGIVLKALRAFSNVLRSGGRFSEEYPVNAIVEINEASITLTQDENERVQATLSQPPALSTKSKLDVLIDQLFELDGEGAPTLLVGIIADSLNAVAPGIVQGTASLGKALRSHYGERLHAKRSIAGISYNLRFSNPTDTTKEST